MELDKPSFSYAPLCNNVELRHLYRLAIIDTVLPILTVFF